MGHGVVRVNMVVMGCSSQHSGKELRNWVMHDPAYAAAVLTKVSVGLMASLASELSLRVSLLHHGWPRVRIAQR